MLRFAVLKRTVFVNDNSIACVSTVSCIDPYVTMATDCLVGDIASK